VHPVLLSLGNLLIPSYGAIAALGVVLALLLAQRTARMVAIPASLVWNLCVVSLFAAIVAQRLLLVLLNFSDLRRHPAWMLALAMIHHPLLGAVGAFAGGLTAFLYASWRRLPLATTADALAAPLALGLAFEQMGALLAGSGYGTPASVAWAVTYTNPLAARWSGTPLGIALHPVQAYAALAFLALSLLLLLWLPARKQQGDVAGLWMMGTGVAVFLTELWRDSVGYGAVLDGALDGPQVAAVGLVLLGGLLLLERKKKGIENEAEHG
jgi:phosphatidylglycerol:prolipoprotein diacylglycerol transferase